MVMELHREIKLSAALPRSLIALSESLHRRMSPLRAEPRTAILESSDEQSAGDDSGSDSG